MDKETDFQRAHLFENSAESADGVAYDTIQQILLKRRNDDTVYCKYYSGARLIRELTFAQFCNAALGFGSSLVTKQHIQPGDKIIVAMENSHLALIAHAGLLAIGAIIVPVNPAELVDYIDERARDCEAAGLIYSARENAPHYASVRFQFALSDEVMDGFSEIPDLPHVNGSNLATIIYSSGTTGKSKGVLLTQKNWLINSEGLCRMHHMDTTSVHMCVLPLFHVNAFGFSFIATLLAGSRLIINRSFYGPAFWKIMQRECVDVVSVSPVILRALIEQRHERVTAADLPALRYFVTAASAMSEDVLRRFLDKFHIRVLQGYGLSEATNFNLNCDPHLDEAGYQEAMFGHGRPSSGRALYGSEFAVMSEDGKILSEGEEGEIVIRGWTVGQGYLNQTEDNRLLFAHGWLHSGDKGKSHMIGGVPYFFITGRLKEIIKRAGEIVAPVDLEERLRKEPGLEDCVVVGFENTAVGEEVGLYVVSNQATPPAESILVLCQQLFPMHRAPKVVVFGQDIPATSTGKVKRRQLAAVFHEYKEIRF